MNNLQGTIESLILTDENYAAQMDSGVLPLLDAQKEELWIPREDNPQQKLYCGKYTAPRGDGDIRGIVIISHGYTENADKYKEVVYYFLKMGYHVYIPDHCGHGRSYRLTEDLFLVHVDSYKRYVEDLLSVAHRAKSDYGNLPLYLYGHSMGGGIAAAAAAAEPDLFKKAILSSPMIRRSEPLFQNTCGTYRWTRSAGKLHHHLMHTAWKQLRIPLLLFQAEDDGLVSPKAQYRFILKISRRYAAPTWLIKVPGSRHEIYNAEYKTLVKYWTKIFRFLG